VIVICGVTQVFFSFNCASGVEQEAGDVFEEDDFRRAFVFGGPELPDDSSDIRPDPSLVCGSLALTGETERLAREARSNDIHKSAPRSTIEGGKMVPVSRFKCGAFLNARLKPGGAICFPLHHSDGPIAVAREFEAPNTQAASASLFVRLPNWCQSRYSTLTFAPAPSGR
jgi:hypothetical protein